MTRICLGAGRGPGITTGVRAGTAGRWAIASLRIFTFEFWPTPGTAGGFALGRYAVDATRARRTRDRTRQAWYARHRQRRFARFLGFDERPRDSVAPLAAGAERASAA